MCTPVAAQFSPRIITYSLCPEQNQSCEEIVSTHYYSSRLQREMCCYNCGIFGDLKPISDEMKRSFQSVHPICTDCSTQGKKERTRGPKFAGTKRTATQANLCGLSYCILFCIVFLEELFPEIQ